MQSARQRQTYTAVKRKPRAITSARLSCTHTRAHTPERARELGASADNKEGARAVRRFTYTMLSAFEARVYEHGQRSAVVVLCAARRKGRVQASRYSCEWLFNFRGFTA